MIKYICIAVVAAVVANSPWIIEGANNNCAAVELYALHTVTSAPKNAQEKIANGIVSNMIKTSDGRMAARGATEHFPYIPTSVTCGVGFWKAIFFDTPPFVNAKR